MQVLYVPLLIDYSWYCEIIMAWSVYVCAYVLCLSRGLFIPTLCDVESIALDRRWKKESPGQNKLCLISKSPGDD